MSTVRAMRLRGAPAQAIAWASGQCDDEKTLWGGCEDATILAWWLAREASCAGQGTPKHRRAARVGAELAISVASGEREWRKPLEFFAGRMRRWSEGDDRVVPHEISRWAEQFAALFDFPTVASPLAVLAARCVADVGERYYVAGALERLARAAVEVVGHEQACNIIRAIVPTAPEL